MNNEFKDKIKKRLYEHLLNEVLVDDPIEHQIPNVPPILPFSIPNQDYHPYAPARYNPWSPALDPNNPFDRYRAPNGLFGSDRYFDRYDAINPMAARRRPGKPIKKPGPPQPPNSWTPPNP